MEPAFLRCESHPGRRLADHLKDVVERLQPITTARVWLRLAGLFHDVGKATRFFQAYLQQDDVPPDLKRHAHLGALWLLGLLRKRNGTASGLAPINVALAFEIVRHHHGRLDDLVDALSTPDAAEIDRFGRQLAAMDIDGIRQWLEDTLQEPVPVPETTHHWTAIRVELLRELKMSCTDVRAMERLQRALQSFGWLIEADRDSAAGYPSGSFVSAPAFTSEHVARFRFAGDFGAACNSLIRKARDLVYASTSSNAEALPATEGHLWSLTVPTGAGKTLAAIGWALKRREARLRACLPSCPIIYALPFTSIIDQNAAVLRKLWSAPGADESVLAIHHHLAEPGDIARTGEESLARSWVEGWRADIVCTTFVQVVNAMFHGTCADSRRFANLAGSILILDEVQAFPAELWPVLRPALSSLSEHFGTDILLVTATQPALFGDQERAEIGPSTFPPEIADAFDRYDVHVETAQNATLESLAGRARNELEGHGARSALFILNTVQEALDFFSIIAASDEFSGFRLFHLSTNLRPKDRKRILAEVAACAEPRILIATQVVEAGVDLSFDLVFRALAPLDAVVQAAGRCNRHGTGRRGKVVVVSLVGNSGLTIYGPVHMALARELLTTPDGTCRAGPIPEPKLNGLVSEYFAKLAKRTQTDKVRKVMEAVQMLEFARLRGEGPTRDRDEKKVELISDRRDRVGHFVETDKSDVQTWENLAAALRIADLLVCRQRLHALRNDIGQRIVEVPRQFAYGVPGGEFGVVHVPLEASVLVYDTSTGWKRSA